MEAGDARQYRAGHAPRTYENCERCLTRSEIYALVREVINRRKHENETEGVCDHVFAAGFEQHMQYIRENLEKTHFIVNDDCALRKRPLKPHLARLQNVFNLNQSLASEYSFAVNRYNKRF
ncbi:lef11 [Lambdina fiscellaria nucleopolyhedrovirus]|uniref:Late expression factor 11 n=1 Tax=Lambdina fiscellaria nucleopolyhedrovirus TaxID=1642929 RepID=A0A0E3Z638_9ABAC|nr:lef11 [Lambdina fiscellaria nucleopolyhedrovirus]AKC91732.1 lef11 [Lambdina fiscellaria nucleopolyhedrovirus]